MNQYSYSAPPLSRINKLILIASGVCFLGGAILKAVGAPIFVNYLGLSGTSLFQGHVYQLLTYPLVERELLSFLFNGLIIWFIGSELEGQWGERIYLRFLLLVTVGVGLLYILGCFLFYGTLYSGSDLHGLTGLNLAFLVAYALLYPDRQMSMMMVFPMKARTFCWILVAIEAYMAVFSSLATSWAHLLAMGVSYLIIRFQSASAFKKVFQPSNPKKKQGKNHLYVVKDDDQDPPKYWQ